MMMLDVLEGLVPSVEVSEGILWLESTCILCLGCLGNSFNTLPPPPPVSRP